MIFNDLALSYIKQAKDRIRYSKEAFKEENFPYVVRQCQEAVELLLKASLRIVGVEPPKWHDVGPILRREEDRYPEWFKSELDWIISISRILRRERELAMYGDEELGIPPEEIYTRYDAEEALAKAEKIYDLVMRLYREYKSKDRVEKI